MSDFDDELGAVDGETGGSYDELISAAVEQALQQDEADNRRIEEIETAVNVISGLSAMERRWLIRYLFHSNATLAAKEAGYKWPNKIGPQIRHKPKIQAAIDEYFHQYEMSSREVVARLSQQAKAEYARYIRVGRDGRTAYVDLRALLADGKGHLIKGIKETQYGQTIEFYDAHQALVDVGRYHGLFTDRTDANVAINDSGVTVDEWRRDAEKRRKQAAKTMSQFADEEGDTELNN